MLNFVLESKKSPSGLLVPILRDTTKKKFLLNIFITILRVFSAKSEEISSAKNPS